MSDQENTPKESVKDTTRVAQMTVYHDMLGALMDRVFDHEHKRKELERYLQDLTEMALETQDTQNKHIKRTRKLLIASFVSTLFTWVFLLTWILVVALDRH